MYTIYYISLSLKEERMLHNATTMFFSVFLAEKPCSGKIDSVAEGMLQKAKVSIENGFLVPLHSPCGFEGKRMELD